MENLGGQMEPVCDAANQFLALGLYAMGKVLELGSEPLYRPCLHSSSWLILKSLHRFSEIQKLGPEGLEVKSFLPLNEAV